ncbi:CAMK family protein kinase [Tritrichomonas foetus]|uniref:CAMK family protein kinase n=1 Tax=Tritrichomonas foetus TaxID=1144522 RepID=A0A1J4J8G1_9EUKA|nr:CAMK family protein kinase [Tritrichomonas foetus]|eukprot:OHS93979.1 CAMK family protein kinase [Tritrichomonas foetus]
MLVHSNRYQCELVAKVSEKVQGCEEVNDAEVSNLVRLNHPNIISMYEYFTDDIFLYIILEYCPGGSLNDVVKAIGPLKSDNLIKACYQILLALRHCHGMGIAHRDLKPANVLVDKNNRCKLADFGISNLIKEKQSTTFGGTKPYMAPEILLHCQHDPFKADVWSLAVTFFQLATGSFPWNTVNEKEMTLAITMGIVSYNKTKLKKDFVQLLRAMFEVNPDKMPDVEWVLEQPIFEKMKEHTQRKRLGLSSSRSMGSQLNLASYVTKNCSPGNQGGPSIPLNSIMEDEEENKEVNQPSKTSTPQGSGSAHMAPSVIASLNAKQDIGNKGGLTTSPTASSYQQQGSVLLTGQIEEDEFHEECPCGYRKTKKTVKSLAKSGSVLSFQGVKKTQSKMALNLALPTFA